MTDLAVQAERVSKRYRLGEGLEIYDTIRGATASLLRARGKPDGAGRDLWALREVDLDVEVGETLGIIGVNGAGKSTLLKLLARITSPTSGVTRTRGRVGALLEVGTGFHPELTGRENVYVNGAILGMSRREVNRRFEEIIDFAGVEAFLDTPLKRYSTGMRLRLAFAVAAHAEPDIVVVDEVLAVGDAEFQRRCLGRMARLHRDGRTVLFVSHDLGAIASLCSRVVWIDHGRIRDNGSSASVIEAYLRSVGKPVTQLDLTSAGASGLAIASARLVDDDGRLVDAPQRGQDLTVRVRFVVRQPTPALDLAVYVLNRDGVRVLDECWLDRPGRSALGAILGTFDVSVKLPPVLAPNRYLLGVRIGNGLDTHLDQHVLRFDLLPRPEDRQDMADRQRIAAPSVAWSIEPVRAP
ncbi:MAG: ABC transporter ATP-binding protein [Solirubrobacteraceae bacterium]